MLVGSAAVMDGGGHSPAIRHVCWTEVESSAYAQCPWLTFHLHLRFAHCRAALSSSVYLCLTTKNAWRRYLESWPACHQEVCRT